MDVFFVFLAILAVTIAGLSKGGFGAGATFAATPVLAISVGPVAAAAILLPILVVTDWFSLRVYWRQWRWSIVWPMMLAGIPGAILGWILFRELNVAWLSIVLGSVTLVLLAYQCFASFIKPSTQATKPSAIGAGWWGGLTGFTSFLMHAGGPPFAVYLLPMKLTKREYQASSVLLFTFLNAIKLLPYFALGLFDTSNLVISLWLLPVAPLAVLLGVWAHHKVREVIFYRIAYSLAILASAKLLWDGFAAL